MIGRPSESARGAGAGALLEAEAVNEGRPGPDHLPGAGRDDDAGLGGQEHGGGDQHDVRVIVVLPGGTAPFVFWQVFVSRRCRVCGGQIA